MPTQQEQEIFNRVWEHFVTNKAPASVNPNGVCLYRGPNGEKCAAGVFIPDEAYSPLLESIGIKSLVLVPSSGLKNLIDKFPPIIKDNLGILKDLQRIHDNATIYGDSFSQRIETDLRNYRVGPDFAEFIIPGE